MIQSKSKAVSAFFLSLFLLSSTVSAAEPITTDNIEDFVTVDDDDEIDVETVIHSFDDATSIVDYEFATENSTRVVFNSEIRRHIEIYDVNGFTETGGESVPINDYTIRNGYTEVLVDTTSKRGDRTLFILVDDQYYTLSNDRTSELIGTPDSTLGFVLGIVGGGIAVLTLLLMWIKYKERRIDKAGVRTD